MREFLADYGSWYLILLGLIAVVVVIRYPQGLWGLIADRWDIRFFPVQRRVRLGSRPTETDAIASPRTAPQRERRILSDPRD